MASSKIPQRVSWKLETPTSSRTPSSLCSSTITENCADYDSFISDPDSLEPAYDTADNVSNKTGIKLFWQKKKKLNYSGFLC